MLKRTTCMKGDCHKPPERGAYYCADHNLWSCSVEDLRQHRAQFEWWYMTRMVSAFCGFMVVLAVSQSIPTLDWLAPVGFCVFGLYLLGLLLF